MGAVGTTRGVGAQGRASTLLLAFFVQTPGGGWTQPSSGARPLETVGEMQPTRPRRAEVRAGSSMLLCTEPQSPQTHGAPASAPDNTFPARKSPEQLGGGELLREETPGGGRCTRGTVYARGRGGAARGKMATARAGPAGRGCRGPDAPPPPGWPPGRAAAAGLQAGVWAGEGAPGA